MGDGSSKQRRHDRSEEFPLHFGIYNEDGELLLAGHLKHLELTYLVLDDYFTPACTRADREVLGHLVNQTYRVGMDFIPVDRSCRGFWWRLFRDIQEEFTEYDLRMSPELRTLYQQTQEKNQPKTRRGLLGGWLLNHRASLNLELALIIMLLTLTCIMGLIWIGNGVGNIYNSAAGATEVAGAVSGPSVPDPNPVENPPGSGSYQVGPITGGNPPYRIVHIDDPSGSNPVDVPGSETGPGPIFNLVPTQPGDNYYQVIDGSGQRLPLPIHITVVPTGPNTVVITCLDRTTLAWAPNRVVLLRLDPLQTVEGASDSNPSSYTWTATTDATGRATLHNIPTGMCAVETGDCISPEWTRWETIDVGNTSSGGYNPGDGFYYKVAPFWEN